MNDLTTVSIVSTAESALFRLKRAEIPVFDCKKDGLLFRFSVKDKHLKKVFAIFAKPCYNIKVEKRSFKKRLILLLGLRAGAIAGAVLFVALAMLANSFILKIEVAGSGSYLEPEVRRIVLSEGAGEFRRFSDFNKVKASGRILALPQVTFCNIEKSGSVLKVDVRTDGASTAPAQTGDLVSDCDGTVINISVICGTAAVNAGDAVNKGDRLICAYTLAGEDKVSCIAVGFVEIERAGRCEYFSETDGEESRKQALSSLLAEDGEITGSKITVKPTKDGFVYVIDFTRLHKLTINLT